MRRRSCVTRHRGSDQRVSVLVSQATGRACRLPQGQLASLRTAAIRPAACHYAAARGSACGPCPAAAWPASVAAARKYCSRNTRTALVRPSSRRSASTWRIRPCRSWLSRWQISSKASQSSGSRRMLVRPLMATMLRLVRRLADTKLNSIRKIRPKRLNIVRNLQGWHFWRVGPVLPRAKLAALVPFAGSGVCLGLVGSSPDRTTSGRFIRRRHLQ